MRYTSVKFLAKRARSHQNGETKSTETVQMPCYASVHLGCSHLNLLYMHIYVCTGALVRSADTSISRGAQNSSNRAHTRDPKQAHIPRGGVRPFRQKSTCLKQLTLGSNVLQIWSRNTRKLRVNETFELHCVDGRTSGRNKQGRARKTLHPTPYTLHPTPYTLHPTLYLVASVGGRVEGQDLAAIDVDEVQPLHGSIP